MSIARAFVNRPLILLADEPTGNLDPGTSEGIMRLLDRINKTGTTVVMATHDQRIVNMMRRRVIQLDRGHHRARPGPRGVRVVLNRLGYWLRETLRQPPAQPHAHGGRAAHGRRCRSLLVGVALLARQGVDNQLVQWKGGVEFIVFMKPDATEDQIQSRAHGAGREPAGRRRDRFLDKPAAYEEFQRSSATRRRSPSR